MKELPPEVAQGIREEVTGQQETARRLLFLIMQAQLPLRPLLLGTTAIMTGRIRT